MASDQSNGLPPPLILVGMHRSGTSLAAALLQSAGLNVGDRLMEGNWSNPRGHFEDMDFVDFQRGCLVEFGYHRDGWVETGLPELPREMVEAAREIVERKGRDGRIWGWKDPRTILFLRLWLELLPNARLLLIYRAPWEVIDSLYRRGDEIFSQDAEFAVRMWLRYNRALLDVLDAMPAQCLLVSLETIAAYPTSWMEKVRDLIGPCLAEPDTSLYDPSLLHGSAATVRVGPLFRYYPEVLELYAALESRAWHSPAAEPKPAIARRPTFDAERRLAMRDWHESCAISAECERLRAELRRATDRAERVGVASVPNENGAEKRGFSGVGTNGGADADRPPDGARSGEP